MEAAEFVRGIAVIFGFIGSMVVGDLNIVSVLPFPSEDDAPLFVDTDGMESGQLTFQKLQVVAWRLAKVFE